MLNRRGLIGALFGAAPIAVAATKVLAKQSAVVVEPQLKPVGPFLTGDIRQAFCGWGTASVPSHSHSHSVTPAIPNYEELIWDGGKWERFNSPEGQTVAAMLR